MLANYCPIVKAASIYQANAIYVCSQTCYLHLGLKIANVAIYTWVHGRNGHPGVPSQQCYLHWGTP